ncbi:MAG: transposase [bacterium]|nr:transposase [bacterium]
MARQARQESSTGYYHVMARGINNREFLFRRDAEKNRFLELVKDQQDAELLKLIAYCVMDNHVHLIIKAAKTCMSKAVKVISLRFAAYYNRSHNRIGPVFGDRFRSEKVESDAYLLGALRYIHRNPVKANIVQDVTKYRSSSYSEYLNAVKYIDEAQKLYVLELFNNSSQSFAEFHVLEDDEKEYLETAEDLEKWKAEFAVKVFERFCEEKGIREGKEIISNPELFEEICRLLTQQARLSLRETAKLMEVTHKMVYRALREDE